MATTKSINQPCISQSTAITDSTNQPCINQWPSQSINQPCISQSMAITESTSQPCINQWTSQNQSLTCTSTNDDPGILMATPGSIMTHASSMMTPKSMNVPCINNARISQESVNDLCTSNYPRINDPNTICLTCNNQSLSMTHAAIKDPHINH